MSVAPNPALALVTLDAYGELKGIQHVGLFPREIQEREGPYDDDWTHAEEEPLGPPNSRDPGKIFPKMPEQPSVVKHCSTVLLSRMFTSLADSFRFFLQDKNSEFIHLIAKKIPTSSIPQSLNRLLLRTSPTPRPFTATWGEDVAAISAHCCARAGEAQELSFESYLSIFAATAQEYYDALKQSIEWAERLRRRVEMDQRVRDLARKWALMALMQRSRAIMFRWVCAAAAWGFDFWKRWTIRRKILRGIEEAALAKRREVFLRRMLNRFRIILQALALERKQLEEEARLRAPVRQFLKSHPFIKDMDQAFLAGVTAPVKLVTRESVEQEPGFLHATDQLAQLGTLYQYVKAMPLASNDKDNARKKSQVEAYLEVQQVESPRAAQQPLFDRVAKTDSPRAKARRLPTDEATRRARQQQQAETSEAHERVLRQLESLDAKEKERKLTPQQALVFDEISRPHSLGAQAKKLPTLGEIRERWKRSTVVHTVKMEGVLAPKPTNNVKVPYDRDPLLDVSPSVVHFDDFQQIGVPVSATLQITNVCGQLRRVRVMPAQSVHFTVTTSLTKNGGRLAAGMSATVNIVLLPLEKRSYYDCIVIHVEDPKGAKLAVPVHAKPAQELLYPEVPLTKGYTETLKSIKPVQAVYRMEQFALAQAEAARLNLTDLLVQAQQQGDAASEETKDLTAALAELEHEIFLGGKRRTY